MAAPANAVAEPIIQYLESSAILAALLEHDARVEEALRAPGRQRVTSALTIAEAYRGVVRARRTDRISEADEHAAIRWLQLFAQRCEVIAVTDAVLARAGRPFPVEPIRTLDAIHLATVEFMGQPPPLIEVVTRDTRIRDNASALGHMSWYQ